MFKSCTDYISKKDFIKKCSNYRKLCTFTFTVCVKLLTLISKNRIRFSEMLLMEVQVRKIYFTENKTRIIRVWLFTQAAVSVNQSSSSHKLQFVIGDHVLPYNMTVYQAIRQFSSPSDASASEADTDTETPISHSAIWLQTHTIYYRQVTSFFFISLYHYTVPYPW